MTDWEKQLKRNVATAAKTARAVEQSIAAARLDGHTFRELGAWAEINHESARKICLRINGHTQTRKEREGKP